MALVLTRFHIDPHASEGTLVHITGRDPGVVGWLKSKLGMSVDQQFVATTDTLVVGTSVPTRGVRHMVPLGMVSSTLCGMAAPRWLLYLAGALAAFGLFGAISSWVDGSAGAGFAILGVAWGIAGICVLIYYLNREIALTVETSGGSRIGLVFKPSVIEGVRVDVDRAMAAIDLLNAHVMASRGAAASDAAASLATRVPVQESAPPGPPPRVRVRDLE